MQLLVLLGDVGLSGAVWGIFFWVGAVFFYGFAFYAPRIAQFKCFQLLLFDQPSDRLIRTFPLFCEFIDAVRFLHLRSLRFFTFAFLLFTFF